MIDVNKITDDSGVQRFFRDGIELDKGVMLSEERVIEHEELYKKYCEFFTAYPDLSI